MFPGMRNGLRQTRWAALRGINMKGANSANLLPLIAHLCWRFNKRRVPWSTCA